MRRHYFAYGANLVRAAMARRCPGARVLGRAVLKHHRFAIVRAGHGTVLPRTGTSVHGVLWLLGRGNVAALDRYEEVAAGLYRRERRVVAIGRRAVPALVYVAARTAAGRARDRYLADIITAGRAFAFPADYLTALQAMVRTASGASPASRSARRLGEPSRLA